MGDRERRIMIGLLSLGALGGVDLTSVKIKPSNRHCTACHKQIPQGRAGRKCTDCRRAAGEIAD